ncbi:hypothetical protein [Bradyrhizobium sp. 62]|uniref:hypothetical protein n=1 Tax=Bradyrhizobium sp. 62 TaxID=1043588 RepID=UPI001FF85758|nr:hypothetical protein [Bradyrhizobium sp. 62]MCK1366386.1 hypothetical protein [Bradyrhizobium sp. 62]
MFNTRRDHDNPASWAYYLRQQELALAGEINIREITTAVVGDDCSYVEHDNVKCSTVVEALSASPFPQLADEVVSFFASNFCVHYLIPVADPHSTGPTWPSILVPSEDDPVHCCFTDEEQDRMLEILREWRRTVDIYASTIPCSRLGWIGGVAISNPDSPDEISMRWPWLHRPYGLEGRPGDRRLFELFEVSVDRRRY